MADTMYSLRKLSGNKAQQQQRFHLAAPDPRSAEPALYSPKSSFLSEALDSADSVRFSKFELFERLRNLNEMGFCSSLGLARAADFQFAISRFDPPAPASQAAVNWKIVLT
jgi:hypothetical protein